MNDKEFKWDDTRYELVEIDMIPGAAFFNDNIPVIKFRGKVYFGQAINDIQKVKEPDYEILERLDYYGGAYDGDLAPIKKVRRLSDNEVFSIGDILHDGCIETVITSISGGDYPILKGDKGSIGLDVARKKRVPLFTTEDDKEIFEGDTYWTVGFTNFDYWYSGAASEIFDSGKYETHKYFSTEDLAREYIKWNKPCLSAKDIITNFDNFKNQFSKPFHEHILELAQQKINNQ